MGNRIGRITTAGVIAQFSSGISSGASPLGITAGPGGDLWFTETYYDQIGRITTAGAITEFYLPNPTYGLGMIAKGPDNNLWFTETGADRIGRITPAGVVTEFNVSSGAMPWGIVAGPDGNLWFTERGKNRIGRITPAGVVTEFTAGTTGTTEAITAGPDGNLWYTKSDANLIGRITPTGVVTEFSAGITANAGLLGITAGPDGNIWFTEFNISKIGRLTLPAGPTAPTATTGAASSPRGHRSDAQRHGFSSNGAQHDGHVPVRPDRELWQHGDGGAESAGGRGRGECSLCRRRSPASPATRSTTSGWSARAPGGVDERRRCDVHDGGLCAGSAADRDDRCGEQSRGHRSDAQRHGFSSNGAQHDGHVPVRPDRELWQHGDGGAESAGGGRGECSRVGGGHRPHLQHALPLPGGRREHRWDDQRRRCDVHDGGLARARRRPRRPVRRAVSRPPERRSTARFQQQRRSARRSRSSTA